jgi:hypothetical protein
MYTKYTPTYRWCGDVLGVAQSQLPIVIPSERVHGTVLRDRDAVVVAARELRDDSVL